VPAGAGVGTATAAISSSSAAVTVFNKFTAQAYSALQRCVHYMFPQFQLQPLVHAVPTDAVGVPLTQAAAMPQQRLGTIHSAATHSTQQQQQQQGSAPTTSTLRIEPSPAHFNKSYTAPARRSSIGRLLHRTGHRHRSPTRYSLIGGSGLNLNVVHQVQQLIPSVGGGTAANTSANSASSTTGSYSAPSALGRCYR
jgi:hypothetical protein